MDYGNELSNKLQVIVDYCDMEILLFHDLALYVSHLENKYTSEFQPFSSLLEKHFDMGLQLPFIKNKIDLAKIKSSLESWLADQKFEPKSSAQKMHFKITNRKLLRKLQEDFNMTVSIPISKGNMKEVRMVGSRSYFNSNTNIRLTGAFAALVFDNRTVGPNMPPKIWVWIDQHPIHKLRINGNVFHYKLYKPWDAFNTVKAFSVTQSDFEEESREQMARNDCCLKRCTASEISCPSPFADFTLSVPRGKQVRCPENEDHYNCKGISLRGLEAIHLFVKYASVPEKLWE